MIRNQDETTVSQSRRLVKAGCGIVKVTMEGHEIVFHPVPLGKLWDVVSGYWPDVYEFSTDLRSCELIESLVRIIEEHSAKEPEKHVEKPAAPSFPNHIKF